ncbi:hypothetical protein DAEQUDRAFT_524514 [Daedalea quercina L-15889]|uniref:Uncharacterized protein n=1 Tax=Daedalea quercina L-15889 TaxID=1314783 RepID=A0A165MBL0_9APHY|nr:hypothetical protein DAEQUDRAFT_524514 [Daedalea quercina L-15889]
MRIGLGGKKIVQIGREGCRDYRRTAHCWVEDGVAGRVVRCNALQNQAVASLMPRARRHSACIGPLRRVLLRSRSGRILQFAVSGICERGAVGYSESSPSLPKFDIGGGISGAGRNRLSPATSVIDSREYPRMCFITEESTYRLVIQYVLQQQRPLGLREEAHRAHLLWEPRLSTVVDQAKPVHCFEEHVSVPADEMHVRVMASTGIFSR